MRLALLLSAVLFAVLASTAQAGTIHPALEARMDALQGGDPVGVIVHMSEQAPIAELNEQLRAERSTLGERHSRVIEALKLAAGSQDPFLASLDAAKSSGEVIDYTPYWISNLVVVYAAKDEIYRIAARGDVDFIEPNFTVSLIEPVGEREEVQEEDAPPMRGIGVPPGIRAARAPEVWYGLGLNGAGTLIGSLDTGVDGYHPALASRWRGTHAPWQECWLDLLGGSTTFPVDDYGHGTHTTGTMTGMAPDDTIGMAWGAEWIACNPIDQGVSPAFDNDIIAAFQWFADPDGNPGTTEDVPDVVQNSWGVYEAFGYPDCDSRWWAVIDNCEAAGVVTCWSAGNEGPGAGTLRSPADRATTLTNAFSVGAVNATSYSWPYPIASFSSRGPSGCNVPAENKIKPEVVAPGVTVYSSVPGGGYEQTGWDGTSMAGPHVAGTVALIRQANPNLDVDSIKTLIMEAARDEGTAGEDNTYGHGFIDAQAAVLAAMAGYGQIEGVVTNGSYGGVPLPGARVELVGTGFQWMTMGDGSYAGYAPAGSYTARATMDGFDPLEYSVDIVGEQLTVQDFALTDIAGPEISQVDGPLTTTDETGPYVISAEIVDYSTIASAKLYYRVSGGSWTETPMTQTRGHYEGSIPGSPANTQIDYYVWAEDGIALTTTNPPDAPTTYYSLYVTETFYAHEAEDPGDPDWLLGMPGDAATTGIWVRVDPNGTSYSGVQMQPEDDHTPAPGLKCFVTGQGAAGGAAGDADVDGGCTTLRSPIFDLSTMSQAFVRYWRWYAEGGLSSDDEFAVDVSDDGGATWVALERVPSIANQWNEVTADIADFVDLTGQVVFRFVACDLNTGGLVEAGIDDFAIETFAGIDTDVEATADAVRRTALLTSRPNPYTSGRGDVTIRFQLAGPERVEVKIYDLSGRVVATLADGRFSAGEHRLSWNGRGPDGAEVASGVYFYRLKSGSLVESRRLTILR
jgi:subtilisin family serine protease